MRYILQIACRVVIIIAICLIPLDFILTQNPSLTSSLARCGIYLGVAWAFVVVEFVVKPRQRPDVLVPKRTVRSIINQLSTLAVVALLIMTPLSILVEYCEWGSFPDGFSMACFFYAFLFAIVREKTADKSARRSFKIY